ALSSCLSFCSLSLHDALPISGPLRPESLRALEGLDGVVGLWEQVAAVAPRRYEVVVLSDHGQSLGPTFEQVAGRTFLDEVRRLIDRKSTRLNSSHVKISYAVF